MIGDPQTRGDASRSPRRWPRALPWFKFFLDYDPAPTLRRSRCPVLAIFGETRPAGARRPNRRAMEEVLKSGGIKDYRIVVMARRESPLPGGEARAPCSEYTTLKKEFVPGFLDLLDHVDRRRAGLAAKK